MNKEQTNMKQEETKGILSRMYGDFVQVPHSWYGLCRKYAIPKEVKEFTGKKENTIELNPMEINVLAYLGNYEKCYVPNGKIADVFNVKKQTIEKYIKELRWVGFIKTFETKDNPTHTERRNIYVQHDAIKAVLKSEANPYTVPYERKISYECKVPYRCDEDTLHSSCDYLTDVMQAPYEHNANKKVLESIKKNKKYTASPIKENSSLIVPSEQPVKEKIRTYDEIPESEHYDIYMACEESNNDYQKVAEEHNATTDAVKRIDSKYLKPEDTFA